MSSTPAPSWGDLTYGDQMCVVFQGHIPEEVPLSRVQLLPFFLGEVYYHVLEGHGFLKHQAQLR